MLDWRMLQQELQRISRWICGRKRGNEMITGVHHVCVKCRPEDLEKASGVPSCPYIVVKMQNRKDPVEFL